MIIRLSPLMMPVLVGVMLSCQADVDRTSGMTDKDQLAGVAEDLWGNPIDLNDYRDGVVTISPFSPATCGYCLLDGHFIEANYHAKTEEMDGRFLYMSLFVPQLDIYTFLKHYRCEHVPTLTYPLSLQKYQETGFPYLMAFRDGRKLFAEVISDYHTDYKDFVQRLWPDHGDDTVTLASPRKLASNSMGDDTTQQVTYVIPDSRSKNLEEERRRYAYREGIKVVLERDLTADDLQGHLAFEGFGYQYDFDIFSGPQTPIRFDSTHVFLGDYTFDRRDVGLVVAFPNPYNREMYVWMRLTEYHTGQMLNQLWCDFAIWRYQSQEQPAERLLDGFFAKQPGNVWEYADSLTIAYTNLAAYCKGGVCPLPPSAFSAYMPHEYHPSEPRWQETDVGQLLGLGERTCRFPSIAAGAEKSVAVAWEEEGDIIVAVLDPDREVRTVAVECGSHDSFNPVLAYNGQSFLVAYLCDKDGWYRLYGRFLDDDRLSPEILISEMGSYDVITPALTSDGDGHITAVWSMWQANSRPAQCRTVDGRTLGSIQPLTVVPGDLEGYINAWYFDLAYDEDGGVVGAWNQHYPAILGVCAGDLTEQATSVTQILGNISRNENGGYPATAFDAQGRQWVVWETFWWDTHKSGRPQQILASYRDTATASWSTPYTVSSGTQTYLNQSPQLVTDQAGTTWVTWSGRFDHRDSTWGIYLSRFTGGSFSEPVLVSRQGDCARAPDIAADSHGRLWLTWHSGIGEAMSVQVLSFRAD